MLIESIICENTKIYAFSPTSITLLSFLTFVTANTEYYILASHEGVYYSAHFAKVWNKIGGGCSTWANITTKLTTGLLLGYKRLAPRCEYMWNMVDERIVSKPMPTEPTHHSIYRKTKSVNTYSFDNTFKFDGDFGSKDSPSIRNIINYKFKLKDLVLRKTNEYDPIQLENTIPIVNGVAFCPIYSLMTKELFVPGAMAYLPISDNKNTVLIDFSPLGNIQKIKLNTCTRKAPHRDDILEIILPSHVTTENKSVILVLGGRLFFPGDFYVAGNRQLVFYIKDNFNNILISNRIYKKDYDNIFTVALSHLHHYVNTEMWDTLDYNNFIILIDNPKIKVIDNALDDSTHSVSLTSPNLFGDHQKDSLRNIFLTSSFGTPRGILMRNSNRDIVDYVKIDKHSRDIIMVPGCSNVIIPDTDIGYVENNAIKTYGEKTANSSFVMKEIIAEVE